MNSFFSCSSNVDRVEQRLFTRRTGLFIAVASALLLAVVSCVSVQHIQSKNSHIAFRTSVKAIRTSNEFLKGACDGMPHPQVCVSTLAGFSAESTQANPPQVVNVMVKALIGVVERTFMVGSKMTGEVAPGLERDALEDCLELLDMTVDDLSQALSKFSSNAPGDVKTFLSAGLTNQDTCMEGFATAAGVLKNQFLGGVIQISELVSNSLAMFNKISSGLDDMKRPPNSQNRRLLDLESGLDRHDFGSEENGFPGWLSAGDRRLLQVPQSNVTADVVVALDGTGNYTNITDAVIAAPDNSVKRYVIHVKAGVYHEQVVIKKKKTNLMFIGDGMDSTVVTGNLNVFDGTTTFHSASFAVSGSGFIARDIGFENTAGPFKNQAVALRVGSDQSVFYRCSMKGYQDTLYAHSLRQFYRECKIYGTVDFIFGNAAVVFQNCIILARKPLTNQTITVTAQGRKDPNQNTGTSIHNCNISAAPDLAPVKSLFPAYLGRPWRPFSRTVIMQSYLGDIIHPQGWVPWNASNLNLDTLYYGEYMNFGPGAGVANRVQWPGFHSLNNSVEANSFTVAQFIDGNKWLPSTGVTYLSGLKL